MITEFSKYLNARLTIVIPVMMIAGLIYGTLIDASHLRALILPLTFLMVYPMMVSLRMEKVFSFADMRVQLVAQLINFAIVPFVALAIGQVFFGNQPFLLMGFVLAGLVPTSGMTLSYTGMAKGNREAALKITVLGLVLGSLLTPIYMQVLLGATVPMDLGAMFRSIFVVIFLPLALAYGTQRLIIARKGEEAFYKKIGPKFGPVSTLGVVGMVFVAIALKADTILESPELVLLILVPIVIIYAANYALATIVGRLMFERGDAIALVFGTSMRNLSVALSLAMNAFGEDGAVAALVIALAYVIQVQSAVWYIKFTDNLLGKPPSKAEPAE